MDAGAKAEGEDVIQRLSTCHSQEQSIWHGRVLEDGSGVSPFLSIYPVVSLWKRSTRKQIQELKFAHKRLFVSLTQ